MSVNELINVLCNVIIIIVIVVVFVIFVAVGVGVGVGVGNCAFSHANTLAYRAPDRKTIDVELVPVLGRDCLAKFYGRERVDSELAFCAGACFVEKVDGNAGFGVLVAKGCLNIAQVFVVSFLLGLGLA